MIKQDATRVSLTPDLQSLIIAYISLVNIDKGMDKGMDKGIDKRLV
jgi:hypothetical protein